MEVLEKMILEAILKERMPLCIHIDLDLDDFIKQVDTKMLGLLDLIWNSLTDVTLSDYECIEELKEYFGMYDIDISPRHDFE